MTPPYETIQSGTLIDVRSPEEFADGHHPLAINIPLDQIEASVDRIRSLQSPLFACCKSGIRSGSAVQFLQSAGIEIQNVGAWHLVPTKSDH